MFPQQHRAREHKYFDFSTHSVCICGVVLGVVIYRGKIISTMKEKRYKRPAWIAKGSMTEEDLCPECFKAVGVKSRYKLICTLGKAKQGASVNMLTKTLGLRQPTVTHHLNVLKSIDAVSVEEKGRQRVYTLNREAHCFQECQIPY